jgi:hypothetical protein
LPEPLTGRFGTGAGWVSLIAVAMRARLVHHAEILSLKGDSFRLRGKDATSRPQPTVVGGEDA